MTKCIGIGLLAITLICSSATIDFAAASPSRVKPQNEVTARATDFGGHPHSRQHARYIHRAYAAPPYYDRPIYYVPAPYVPFNFGYPLLPPPWW